MALIRADGWGYQHARLTPLENGAPLPVPVGRCTLSLAYAAIKLFETGQRVRAPQSHKGMSSIYIVS